MKEIKLEKYQGKPKEELVEPSFSYLEVENKTKYFFCNWTKMNLRIEANYDGKTIVVGIYEDNNKEECKNCYYFGEDCDITWCKYWDGATPDENICEKFLHKNNFSKIREEQDHQAEIQADIDFKLRS